MAAYGYHRRAGAAPAALFTCLMTLSSGAIGTPVTGITAQLSWGMLGLALVTGAGLLAWHIAQCTMLPVSRGQAASALPAALIPIAVLPHLGVGAAIIAIILALEAAYRDPAHRHAALAILCGCLFAFSGVTGALALAAIPACWLSLRAVHPAAANDNPSLERLRDIWPLQKGATYANQDQTCDSGTWGVA